MDATLVETKRLILRAPTPDDLESVFAVHADPLTNQYNPAGPQRSLGEARQLLNSWLEHWRRQRFGYWALSTRLQPQVVIGFGGMMYKVIEGERLANLYYRFRPAAWGQGYATEMGQAAMLLAFDELHLPEMVATVRPQNCPSTRVLERLGMDCVGIVADQWGNSLLYKRSQ